MLLKGAAQQLAELMVKLSNQHHHSEWAFGLEYELWNEMMGNQDLLSDAEVGKLRETSERCEGWITMAYLEGEEQLTFVDLDRWKVQYRDNKPF
jgi:hypothetical protein